MEYPKLGKQCSVPDCKQLDFLPTDCDYCHTHFCSHHVAASSHQCSKVVENRSDGSQTGQWFQCTSDGCQTRDAVEMLCIKCNRHHCIAHRYHACFDLTPSQARVQKERAPKKQFQLAKEASDKIVEDKLKNAKSRATANKIKLMRIKGFAVGDNRIPIADRVFFIVCPPLSVKDLTESRALYVSKSWTLGKCIDFLAKKLKLNNQNLDPKANKLRLFTAEGNMLGPDQNSPLKNFLDDCSIIDGDNLIIEYIEQESIDASSDLQIPVDTGYKWTK